MSFMKSARMSQSCGKDMVGPMASIQKLPLRQGTSGQKMAKSAVHPFMLGAMMVATNERKGSLPSTNMSCSVSSTSDGSIAEQLTEPISTRAMTFVRLLPSNFVPYVQLMRMEKSIGTWLLLWPGYWALALNAAPGALPDPWLLFYFAIGSVLVRGAGCTVNDMWDVEFDKQVTRCKGRPLASGALTMTQAAGALAIQTALVMAVLLQFNTISIMLGMFSMLLIATYPLMKRITSWPQAYLGLIFNGGILMGYTCTTNTYPGLPALLLWASGIAWTIFYDTIYAHQDAKDDKKAGVRSTAVLFGDNSKIIIGGFGVLNIALLCAAGVTGSFGTGYWGAVVAVALHLMWQLVTVNLESPESCYAKFRSNMWYGAILFAGCVADRLIFAV